MRYTLYVTRDQLGGRFDTETFGWRVLEDVEMDEVVEYLATVLSDVTEECGVNDALDPYVLVEEDVSWAPTAVDLPEDKIIYRTNQMLEETS